MKTAAVEFGLRQAAWQLFLLLVVIACVEFMQDPLAWRLELAWTVYAAPLLVFLFGSTAWLNGASSVCREYDIAMAEAILRMRVTERLKHGPR